MTEPLDREQRVQRGRRVALLLDDEDMKRAFASVKAKCVEDWCSGKTPGAREEAWALQKALAALQSELQSTVADGQYAQAEIDRLQTRKG